MGGRGCGWLAALVVPLACIGANATLAPAASAAMVTDRPLVKSFDGSDATAGAFSEPLGVAVNEVGGSVYVLDRSKGVIDGFNAEGEAVDFSAIGRSSIDGSGTPQGTLELFSRSSIAVADFGPEPGRIYMPGESGQVNAFNAAGEYLWQLPPGTFATPCGVAVDVEGHLWVSELEGVVREFAATGSPPAEIGSFTPEEGICRLDLDAAGNVYGLRSIGGGFYRVDKYTSGSFSTTLDAEPTDDVTVDQSSALGGIFTLHDESFNEYNSTGALVGAFGFNSVFQGQGIGYNPGLDRVYVALLGGVVRIFGPEVTGTTPDPAIDTTSDVGISKATFHGRVNPQGVPNSYYFEWKEEAAAGGWAAARTSTPQSLPLDSAEHPVEFSTNSLRGNTTYQVRLVGENTANGLRTWSDIDTFTTAQAAASPDVTIDPPAGIGATTATVSGTVNPKGDTADWRLQVSTDPTCSEGFNDEALQKIDEGSESPVAVSYDLALLPSQHYCVRLVATNSFGSTISEVKQFETEAVAPDEAEIAFVAPRLDTSARLNARVNPQGDTLTYRFEYSADGGATWIPLESRQDGSESREKIVIGETAVGLTPNTTYRYRLGLLEGSAGPVASLGEEKTFTTRAASTEVECPNTAARTSQHSQYLADCRGIELVNSPDKGNQTVLFNTAARSGEAVLWAVPGGAPGSPTGTGSIFRGERAADGWHSAALAPLAEQQLGGGVWTYFQDAATPDLAKVIMAPSSRRGDGSALVRLDRSQNQEVLKRFAKHEGTPGFAGGDLTDDAAHVLFLNPEREPPQIEEVGEGEPSEVVSIMPDGAESECGLSSGGEGDNFTGPSGAGKGAGRDWRPGYHRISTIDASRLYFEVRPNGKCGESTPLALFERNRAAAETTLIDPGTPLDEPHLIRATENGRVAYFGTESACRMWSQTAPFSCESPESADSNGHEDVYRWDEEAGESRCVTCDLENEVDDVVADAHLERSSSILVSDDFSHIYFTSREKLAPPATPGNPNIYVASGGRLRFVADLPPSAKTNPQGLSNAGGELSRDGNVLVFSAEPSSTLTADTVSAGAGDEELYRYDDADGSLECVSCLHDGVTAHPSGGQFRLSADGSTVAFETAQALLSQDVNRARDVYQWRDGVASLITDGLSENSNPELSAVSENGGDVFFLAVQSGLTGFEHDGLRNLYDARVGGGFVPPPQPLHCTEESCQGPLQAAPALDLPGSSTFRGRGNAKQRPKPRCHKHKVRRHGRCVSRHRSRSRGGVRHVKQEGTK